MELRLVARDSDGVGRLVAADPYYPLDPGASRDALTCRAPDGIGGASCELCRPWACSARTCFTGPVVEPELDPDSYPPIDPSEPVPDDPGELLPDTPETLPPAPAEPGPGDPEDPDGVPEPA